MHVFRQSRAVLRIVTLHALLLPPPHSLLPLDFIPFPNVCCAPSSFPPPFFVLPLLPSSCLSHAVLQLAGYSSPNSSNISICFSLSSYSVSRAGKGIRSVLPCSVPQGCSLHTCCLSCRSLLCAGGPFPPPEEAGLLPHTDLHPSYNGGCAVTSLFLDQQRVCSCTHSRWYAPLPTNVGQLMCTNHV